MAGAVLDRRRIDPVEVEDDLGVGERLEAVERGGSSSARSSIEAGTRSQSSSSSSRRALRT
jgi:hypothetical protein